MSIPAAEAVGGYAAGKGKQAAREVGRARLPTGNRQYQGVILAEFVTAIVITALAPLVKGTPHTSNDPLQQNADTTPYGPDEIKQMVAIGAAYFVLALLSSGKHGRMAAWFGGLILVAIGLAQTQSGGLPGIFGIFQPSKLSAAQAEQQAQAAIQPVGTPGLATVPGAPNATGIFPVITPGGQVIPAGVVEPTPTGSPTFVQTVTGQGYSTPVTAYTGGPGVVTTNTGTQLA